jgi:hypothetical protein
MRIVRKIGLGVFLVPLFLLEWSAELVFKLVGVVHGAVRELGEVVYENYSK